MKKIIRVGTIKEYGRPASIFCKIEIKEGVLSISGAIGPLPSGNCIGGCGQINMEFDHRDKAHNDRRYANPIKAEEINFAPGWGQDMWYDFLEVWKLWHINDMNAGCVHQKALGWGDNEITIVEYEMDWDHYYKLKRDVEKDAKRYNCPVMNVLSIRSGAANLLNSLIKMGIRKAFTKYTIDDSKIEKAVKNTPQFKQFVESGGLKKYVGIKTDGWVRPEEHPDGKLCKPCPVCGYKYGTAWKREELPQEVVEFLKGLPDTDRQPAWA